jgi:hypothetical protein
VNLITNAPEQVTNNANNNNNDDRINELKLMKKTIKIKA